MIDIHRIRLAAAIFVALLVAASSKAPALRAISRGRRLFFRSFPEDVAAAAMKIPCF